jgi:hypothetical protein
LAKDGIIQVQNSLRTPNRQDQKTNSLCHIIVKILSIQNKERIRKAARENLQAIYKGKPIKVTADFSTETLKSGGHGIMYIKL